MKQALRFLGELLCGACVLVVVIGGFHAIRQFPLKRPYLAYHRMETDNLSNINIDDPKLQELQNMIAEMEKTTAELDALLSDVPVSAIYNLENYKE